MNALVSAANVSATSSACCELAWVVVNVRAPVLMSKLTVTVAASWAALPAKRTLSRTASGTSPVVANRVTWLGETAVWVDWARAGLLSSRVWVAV